MQIPVKSTTQLTELIVKLVEDKLLQIEMGTQSRLKAVKEFNQKEMLLPSTWKPKTIC